MLVGITRAVLRNGLTVLIWVMALAGGFAAIAHGMDKQEKADCLTWRDQAERYPLWYSTDWQREQCEAHDLPLPR